MIPPNVRLTTSQLRLNFIQQPVNLKEFYELSNVIRMIPIGYSIY